jgi:hypothetical protein
MNDESLSNSEVEDAWRRIARNTNRLMSQTSSPDTLRAETGSALAGDDKSSRAYEVSHAAGFNVTASIDHLHALCSLVLDAKVIHIAALATLARGSLETSATAIWVLHPASRSERVARTLKWHAKNIIDGDRAAIDAGLPVLVSLQARMDKLQRAAGTRNLDFDRIKRGYSSTEVVKYADNAIDSVMGVVFPWRLCSGFAHGRPWAYYGFLELEKRATTDPHILTVKISSDLTRTLYLAMSASLVLQAAVKLWNERAQSPR